MANRTVSFFLGLLITFGVLALQANEVFEPLEVRTVDWRFSRRKVHAENLPGVDPSLVIVEITSECLSSVGRWPWARDKMAELVQRIQAGGPRVVGLDIQFYEKDNDDARDRKLAAAIAAVRNVVLASDLAHQDHLDLATGEFVSGITVNQPLPQLKEAARATGLVNIDPYVENPDGILRKTPLAMRVGETHLPGFALTIAGIFLGAEPRIDPTSGRVALGGYEVPTEPGRGAGRGNKSTPGRSAGFEQCAWVNFTSLGAAGGFFQTVPASQVLNGNADAKVFAGKIVLVGFAALGAERDQKLTPVDLMPGVQFQANVIRNLREANFLVRLSPTVQLVVFAILGVVLAWVFSRANLAVGLGVAAIVSAAHIGASVRLFVARGTLLDIVPAVVLVVTLLVVIKLFLLAAELARKIRNLELLNRNSRHFSTTLQLDELKDRVVEVFVKLSGASAGALGVVRDDLDDVDLVLRGSLPEKVSSLLSRRAVQEELITFWKDGPCYVDGTVLARRPKVAPDLADQFAGSVFLPAMHSDRVVGWLMIAGPGLRREILKHEERDFWFTLAAIGLTAIQNGVLYKLATVDSLTTLFVRHFFDIEIEKTFGRASRYQENLALLMTDIDHFKRFNDTYGHQMGDRVLRLVAAEVKRCVRLSDVACRYGGEEFAVVLPATDVEGAKLLAERIRTRIGEIRIPYNGKHLEVTCSIGVSCTSLSSARTTKQFIEEADSALYESKKGGRNRVSVHKGSKIDGETGPNPSASRAVAIPDLPH